MFQPWLSPGRAKLLDDYLLKFLAAPRVCPCSLSHTLSITAHVLAGTDSDTSWQGPLLALVLWVFLLWIPRLTLPVSQIGRSDLPELAAAPVPGATLTFSWPM